MGRRKKQVEDESEDWCFVCKDGGKLVICDHNGCGKAYHPVCVGRSNSILNSEGPWSCSRHNCSNCGAASQAYCLCCPEAVCERCVESSELACVKFEKGMCKDCLELALDAGQNTKFDYKEVNIDFEDPERSKLLFKGYLEIIMKEERLTFDDLRRAQLKKENHGSRSSGFDKFEGKDAAVIISDSDSDNDQDFLAEDSSCGKRKKSEVCDMDFATIDDSCDKIDKSEVGEFVGWGSKPLFDFLKSVGKDVTKRLSKLEVDITISNYILEKNIFCEEKKKIVVFCDEKLYSLFQKKVVHRDEMINLLHVHFAGSWEQANSDENKVERGSCSEGKRRRRLSPDDVPLRENVEYEAQMRSCSYAPMVAENIKLVYLRRSLVEELLMMNPDNFENKVVGSFIRVKAKSGNNPGKISFHLLQVTGIRKTLNGEINHGVLLEIPCLPAAIPIDMLDDGDIAEEECVDLRQRMKDGLFRKPTLAELEQKAKILHEDVTKNWIQRELVRLQKKIDFAHEKGRRYMLDRAIDEREMLKNSSEQQRLLQKLPRVIVEETEIESACS